MHTAPERGLLFCSSHKQKERNGFSPHIHGDGQSKTYSTVNNLPWIPRTFTDVRCCPESCVMTDRSHPANLYLPYSIRILRRYTVRYDGTPIKSPATQIPPGRTCVRACARAVPYRSNTYQVSLLTINIRNGFTLIVKSNGAYILGQSGTLYCVYCADKIKERDDHDTAVNTACRLLIRV